MIFRYRLRGRLFLTERLATVLISANSQLASFSKLKLLLFMSGNDVAILKHCDNNMYSNLALYVAVKEARLQSICQLVPRDEVRVASFSARICHSDSLTCGGC